VIEISAGSAAEAAGLAVGDLVVALNGVIPRDVIEWQQLVDEPELELDVERSGIEMTVQVTKAPGQPLGVDVDAALFDQVRTCDNHCDFCFIYQLPKGMRRTLYMKDDDYRLSFLYGNFTTLTRFTEADLERVITERLSPLYVSIHATDPEIRTDMLKNRRGAMSLRWLRAILDAGIEVHGQVVVCPGWNDADVLEDTLAGMLDMYPELATVGVVPLGISDHAPHNDRLREHTLAEAQHVVDTVEAWQDIFLAATGERRIYAADEYYLLAQRPFPDAADYDDFPMHEDGIGMARTFELEFTGQVAEPTGVASGFFAWVEGATGEGYRDDRHVVADPGAGVPVTLGPARQAPVGILTGAYGAQVLAPLIADIERTDVRILPVPNRFFGGNVGVSGLMVGEDIAHVLADQPPGHRYLLPDVCISNGTFLDGMSPEDLPHPVEVLTTDGIALRRALGMKS